MKDDKKKIYESETLGVPPLKMVLVHAGNEAQNAVSNLIFEDKTEEQLDKERAVRKIIKHLKSDR